MSGKKKRRGRGQEKAAWRPDRASPSFVACSKCGFRVEAARAVETGWSAMEQTALRYRFCPSCGRPMALYPPGRQLSAAAAAAAESGNHGADPSGG